MEAVIVQLLARRDALSRLFHLIGDDANIDGGIVAIATG
jgi:hypothetical protein